uniref:DUF983 domain-containing protein n=1 Tax=Parerythrobacter lutipelagi TaxID=1964208 RepID=UPI0010F7895B|nr:DUF983 domain-containing protein [Parerythrobacter lutipelagi]
MASGTHRDLPHSFGAALLRGLRGRCPRCAEGPLFRRWLKPHDTCQPCQLDLTPQQTDDFPAYLSIFVTGHLLAPLIIMLALDFALSGWQMALIILPLACVLMIGLLQPAKGAVVAVQWWNGMHGFRRERAGEAGGS